MKILELTHFTAGPCGVGKRVLKESLMLAKKGHTVRIFSSNMVKGNSESCPSTEKIDSVEINRFPAKKLGGESFFSWDFIEEAKKFNPDIIIAHSYRHIHTTKALNLAKKLRIPCVLVTHAPFGRESTRTFTQNIFVRLYDIFIGRKTIKRFDRVLIIAPWEMDHLSRLGLSKDKVVYSPNGVDLEFFKKISFKKSDLVTYTGRIAPIKNLEVLINAMSLADKGISLLIYGPAEKDYLMKLKNLVRKNNIHNVTINDKQYNMREQLKLLDKAEVFVLPSKSEGMPQSLIEAMARGKIVIGSDIKSINSIIDNGVNGFTFKENDSRDLAKKINMAMSLSKSEREKIRSKAVSSVRVFKWPSIIDKMDKLLTALVKYGGKKH